MSVRLNVIVDGAGRILERVRNIDAAAKAAQTPAALAMAERTKERVIENLESPKGGELWSRDRLPRHYRYLIRPSGKSGGFPASQYGDLVGSVRVEQTLAGNASLSVGRGLPRPYAFWLEMGWTHVRGGYKHFPFMRPSVESLRDEYGNIVRAEVAKHIR